MPDANATGRQKKRGAAACAFVDRLLHDLGLVAIGIGLERTRLRLGNVRRRLDELIGRRARAGGRCGCCGKADACCEQ
jgi:hypothetical protein